MAENNLLISASILFTGASHTTLLDWANLLHTPIPKNTQFYKMQEVYIIPTVQQAYRDQHEEIIKRLLEHCASGHTIDLSGDARCDSPSFSSKYCTYSFLDDATKEIVHFELVQVTEASSSVAMELTGFQRGLDYLLERGLKVGVVTTDRSPSVRKFMRENYSSIQHEFDIWHVAKGVKKKLMAISSKKDTKPLEEWIKSITNHLYYSCGSSKGDKEVCVGRWTSLLNHISGIHRWEDGDSEYTCQHPPLTEDQQRRKKWLDKNSPAFLGLQSVVMDKNLQRDLNQMALCKLTGSLEVYHSSMLKYAQKRVHYGYDGMRARTQLAILDHNANVERPQATTKKGELRHRFVYPKQSDHWVAKPIYRKTQQAFRDDLMQRVLDRRHNRHILRTSSSSTASEVAPQHRPSAKT
ncbi:uncharacterized protein LOC134453809 [Engraulis encrasicolus]|uniref:uncharacterized protein LOC134453809 n=1 Tax=Engraulis encrasicolus TaxID=184585 RepID=UPI002FD653B0